MISDQQLIFIISQPRAGSTFFQKLLSNNNEVASTSESWILLQFAPFFKPELVSTGYNFKVTNEAFSDYLKKLDLKSSFETQLKEQILSLYQEAMGGQKYFLDKTPRYYEIAQEIITLFPNAKFIVLKRNPLAVLNSMVSTWSSNSINYRSLASYSRDFLKAPYFIQDFYEKNAHRKNVLELKYETLIAKPAEAVKSVYDWLGITYTEDVLDFSANSKTQGLFGDDVYNVKRDPSYKSNPVIESELLWVEQLKKPEVREFLTGYGHFLGSQFLATYGYNAVAVELKNSKIFKDFKYFEKHHKMSKIDILDLLKYKLKRFKY